MRASSKKNITFSFKELSDEEIFAQVQKGDVEKFAVIIRRYQEKLIRYATYLSADDQLAKDIVQESFIQAYINAQSFNPQKKLSSWLYRIVHNKTMDHFRQKKLFTTNLTDYHPDQINRHSSVEDSYIKKELINNTHQCLLNLPLKYREVISLYFLEEKTYQEISEILHSPINTVGTNISRGKQILKQLCQKKA